VRIYINSAPEDLAIAQQLAGLVAQQPNIAPDSPITVEAPADAAAAKLLIDQHQLVVFLLSPEAVRAPWLVEVADYAAFAMREVKKLVVRATLRPYPADSPLDGALRGAYSIQGGLKNLAIQIAYYSTWKPFFSGGRMGFRPTTEAPALEPEPEAPTPPAEQAEPPSRQAGEESDWDGIDQERGVDRDAPAPAPSAPQPPASQPPAPPSGAVGGLPGLPEDAAPITSPAPYPNQEQRQEQQDERKEASRQRGEAAPSAGDASGDASTLQFSAYHPNTVAVGVWQTLIVYTYLAEALSQIQADAATFTELGSAPTVAKGQASRQVEKGVELTVEPHMEGVTFSPERESFIWRGDWRRTLFRFSGAADLAGREQRGWIDIYAGPMVPVARIDLTFPFHDDRGRQLAIEPPRGMIVSSNIYDAAFISYSHRDGEAFRQACDEYARFGVTVYTDEQLEAGAHWEQELRQRIAESNIFHLLWSPHSAASVECRKEWLIALQREASERFIKPWFWRKPLSAPPAEFVQHRISFKYEPLRRSLWRPSTWFA
jgi:TIR domain